MIKPEEVSSAIREYREKLLRDDYRPTFHFALPDSNGDPADPNGAFYADGRYHIMYLYRTAEGNFHWAHISSFDLLHWRHHTDALCVSGKDQGCFSGGAFLDDDGTAYLTFWKFSSPEENGDNGGTAIAFSKPPYEHWERITPLAVEAGETELDMIDKGVRDELVEGKIRHVGCADPSNIWKMNGRYYLQTGNKRVLQYWGSGENADKYYSGDWTDLFCSDDMKNWRYVERFYINPHTDDTYPDETEDDMCPSFLPLYDAKENGNKTDKYLQLFISHNRGCQYYVGELDGERFIPFKHGRMSWNDNTYFAPEALIDEKNRHIMWAWLLDNPACDFDTFGWSGVWSFPRVVWWENNTLRMSPAAELDLLQYDHHSPSPKENGEIELHDGAVFRLRATFDCDTQDKAGFRVRVNNDGDNYASIYYDRECSKLVLDTSLCRDDKWGIKEEAPFELNEGEMLSLDIFVDRSVIEVYANERQAICRRVYPKNASEAVGVYLIGESESLRSLDVWRLKPTNFY